MSALTTRILVLGVVNIFGPANGYQLRRELLSWEVERWAHLNPGSIYSMLSTLEKQGAIERHDVALDGGRPVAVYTITDAGEAEFQLLIYDTLATVPDSGDALPLRVALNFGPTMSRARFLEAVRQRIEVLMLGREFVRRKAEQLESTRTAPPHVASELGLEVALADAQLEWLRQLVVDVERGDLEFVGEPHGTGWSPPADDPGWRMAEDRDRYAARIAELRDA